MLKCHLHKVRTTLCGFLVLGLTSVADRGWSFLTTIKSITIDIDQNFSQSFADVLREKLTYELAQHDNNPHAVLPIMRTHFKCIDSIEAHLYAPGCVHYTIAALLPRYTINKSLALCDNNELMPHHWYTQDLCDHVPDITTTQPLHAGAAPVGLCLMARHIPQTTLDRYEVRWNNDIETILTHKIDKEFTISCDANCIGQTSVYEQCEAIYTDLKNNNPSLKKSSEAIHADMRFANQIVIHADQGRTVHG